MNQRIKQLRKQYKFRQREVADYLNISQSQYAKIEMGERNLKLTKLIKLCDLYHCSEEYLLYGEKEPDKNIPFFKRDNKGIDLKTLARMNKIVRNLYEMKEIYDLHYIRRGKRRNER